MAQLSRKERFKAIKSLSIILGLMIVIYFVSYFLWGVYEVSLRDMTYYPYIKLKSYDFKQVKNYPYTFKNTSVTIDKTDIPNEYAVSTHNGSTTIRTFDNRYYVYEKDGTIALAYPSYDFRGVEYKLFMQNGKVISFEVVPSENVFKNIEKIMQSFSLDVQKQKTQDTVEEFISVCCPKGFITDAGESIDIKAKNVRFRVPKNEIISYFMIEEIVYIVCTDDNFKNRMYVYSSDTNLVQEILRIN